MANSWVHADGGVRVEGLERRTERTLTNQTRVAQLTQVLPAGRSVVLRLASLDDQPVEPDGCLSAYVPPDASVVEPTPDAGSARATLRVGTACDTGSGFSVALAALLVLRRGGLSRRWPS